MQISQFDFSGGMDLVSDEANIPANAYRWLVNARQRFGIIKSVVAPIPEAGAPTGLKQGCVAIGNVTILFVAGYAYYQLIGTTTWTEIANFNMSLTAPTFYSIAVPASSLNYTRQLNVGGNIANGVLQTINFKALGSPACILVQDGINQPWIILYDENTQSFTARPTKAYADWAPTPTGQEYVPIGLNMMFLNQILFIVAPDGLSCYRSVSGQPLNFMVNVDVNGNKLSTENLGGAASVSFAFDYDPITCIFPVNIPNGFIYGTRNNTRVITLDYTTTIFGEPLFSQSAIVTAGILNQWAVADILGDYGFIDYEGVVSFNAVQQLKMNGRNSVFSFAVSSLLDGIKQTYSICIPFNNYVLFNLDTVWGNLFAVYDTLSSKWVALDIFGIAKVTQYALVDSQAETKLIVVTADNNVYQLYAKTGGTLLAGMLLTRGYTVGSNSTGIYGLNLVANELKSTRLDAYFKNGTTAGVATITEICDGSTTNPLTQPIAANNVAEITPINLPTTKQYAVGIERKSFVFRDNLKGFMLQYLIKWTSDAALRKIRMFADEDNIPVGKTQTK